MYSTFGPFVEAIKRNLPPMPKLISKPIRPESSDIKIIKAGMARPFPFALAWRQRLVLLVQPFLERGEIVDDRGRVHFVFARQCLEGLWPWAALAHCQHCLQFRSDRFVVVDRAAIQRTFETCLAA